MGVHEFNDFEAEPEVLNPKEWMSVRVDTGIQSPEMAGVRVRRKSALQYIAVHPHNSSIYLDKRGIRQYVSTRWAGGSLELPAEWQL